MPAVPKKRRSHAQQGERRSHLHLTVDELVSCSHCHQPMRRHHVCPTCGYYGGRLVVERKQKKEQGE
jgi:large subunit ribosomal protein L32